MRSGFEVFVALGGRAFARRAGAFGCLVARDGFQLNLRPRSGRIVERIRVFPRAEGGCLIEALSGGSTVRYEAYGDGLGPVVSQLVGEVV